MQIRNGASVGEIAASAREAARLFETLGIDYACHGNMTLRDACAELHLDPTDVERVLTRLEPEVRSDRRSKPLGDVVRELTGAGFPALQYRLGRVAAQVAEICAGLQPDDRALLSSAFDDLATRVSNHLQREQSELLPRLAGFAAAERVSVSQQLAAFIAEHYAMATALSGLKAAVDHVDKIMPACARLRAAVRELESELRQHMHVENNVLFPRVLPAHSQTIV